MGFALQYVTGAGDDMVARETGTCGKLRQARFQIGVRFQSAFAVYHNAERRDRKVKTPVWSAIRTMVRDYIKRLHDGAREI